MVNEVSKVKTVDGAGTECFQLMTNEGQVEALNRNWESGSPEPAKTNSMTSIVNAAAHGGFLEETPMKLGEQYFALDPDSGYICLAEYAKEIGDNRKPGGIKIG